jgi:hypothetical protein
MGNVTTTMHSRGDADASTSNEVLIRWLDHPIAERGYPSHESDIATLMVFDHQMHAMNLLTRLNWESRVAALAGNVNAWHGELGALVGEVADYFLFVGEVPPPSRLTPRAGFAAGFTARGPMDSRGRSLRQLDLETRLLTYPCSYMIYSEAFDSLPAVARAAVYRRISDVLTGRDATAKYAHLSAADRRAITEILRETKPDWPASP